MRELDYHGEKCVDVNSTTQHDWDNVQRQIRIRQKDIKILET